MGFVHAKSHRPPPDIFRPEEWGDVKCPWCDRETHLSTKTFVRLIRHRIGGQIAPIEEVFFYCAACGEGVSPAGAKVKDFQLVAQAEVVRP